MNTAFPDNAINTELKARLNNLDVDGTAFKFFVRRATVEKAKNYFLKSTQLSTEDTTKCGKGWRTSTEIQVTVISKKNTGSEALLNKAVEELRLELEDFTLPESTGMKVNSVSLSIANDFSEDVGSDIVDRKIVRMETLIT